MEKDIKKRKIIDLLLRPERNCYFEEFQLECDFYKDDIYIERIDMDLIDQTNINLSLFYPHNSTKSLIIYLHSIFGNKIEG